MAAAPARLPSLPGSCMENSVTRKESKCSVFLSYAGRACKLSALPVSTWFMDLVAVLL